MKSQLYRKVSEPIIGRKYHVSWARSLAMVWKLKEVKGNMCNLITKKGKEVTCRIDELLEINKNIK